MTTPNKREREQKRDNKQKEKERRRRDKRFAPRGGGPEIVTAADIIGHVPSIETVMQSLYARDTVDRSAAPIPVKLFVGSLSDLTTSARLRLHFEPHGAIAEAVVITNRETGLTRNFGFVTMVDRKDAVRTIGATHLSELDGHRIVVNVATER